MSLWEQVSGGSGGNCGHSGAGDDGDGGVVAIGADAE